MTEKLKPCPFCGEDPAPLGAFMVCSGCESATHKATWNRRAQLTAANALEVPEVRALVEQCTALGHLATMARLLAPFLAAMEGGR